MGLHRLTSRLVEESDWQNRIPERGAAGREVMKELVEIPVRSDRFRNLEKSLVLAM